VSESAFKSVLRESVLVSEKMCVRACVNVDESMWERDSTCERHEMWEWCARRHSRNVWGERVRSL
jgi:hypothetical protein